jgi:hypothetical protein
MQEDLYLSALADVRTVLTHLCRLLGVPKTRQKEIDKLARELALVLAESRKCPTSHRYRIVK